MSEPTEEQRAAWGRLADAVQAGKIHGEDLQMLTDARWSPLLAADRLALHLERLELAAKTLEAYTGDPRNNRARDVREAMDELRRLGMAR